MVKAYLEYFYPKIAAIADLSTLQQQKVQSLRPNLKLFSADVVYRCQLEGGSGEHFYFCLLFEHKSEPDEHVAVQIGLYIFLLLREQVKAKKQPLEPVLPLLFYNGKATWQPKRIREIFKGHPGYEVLKPYLPDFRFLFEDAHRLPPEELLKLDLSYFRSTVLSMALRHKPDLIFEYIEVIFEGAEDSDQVLSIITYILGVAERSPKRFLEELENTEFTTKPNVMSTLEQLLEMGREEGVEKGLQKGRKEGIHKNSIFNLLKTATRFPEWTADELSDFTELDLETVQTFLSVQSQGDAAAMRRYVLEDLLAGIPLNTEDEEKLDRLIGELAGG
ncbi:Rpn family recombination-promoting nuclease/putative transposase [Phaeodactylibacter sp.]|uniref:Rpn family recombination-promoting nuclease/putative transposase n=1 Tax=Phaeodactylibacter sp. TaxID=1940289 RepID=UPI0025DDA88E|nr:Rpn family recombination-promoting nuclease/putative transposase [Phaeodactylibacter sp.]MCI4646857.1 Rpn family recombination-promoting nuclease/putative transposase [Phaeodactylibacter sp.]MCI5091592.1 Rpn family recombination-promoting nuclease/putative transposase [Phaeodactylibacter sp.]